MRAAFVLLPIALLAACKVKQEPAPIASEAATATAAATAPSASASASAAPAAFTPESVPESTASLPPFPLFKDLEGLENVENPKLSNVAFDRDHFIAGGATIAVEGKLFRGKYNLGRDRSYSSIEFRRNYEMAVAQLGGTRIAGTLDTGAARRALEGTSPEPTGYCFSFACDEADFYLIRQGGKEWWIAVATGVVPLHGFVTVLEKQGMAKSFAFLDADKLKAALDANGRVPVYIEFDIDRASLRPSARPAIDEIVKLMQQNAALKVSIEGHTDDTGTPARNQPLSLARAETVRAELIAAGIAPARMKTAGFGAIRPLAPGTGEDARARNRRVELVRM